MKALSYFALLVSVVAISADAIANPIRIEAEDMTLNTYRVENLSSASNGAVINLKGPGIVGSAETIFPGQGGDYDIFIAYHDESDGVAQMTVSLSDGTVETLTLDELTGDRQPTADNLRIRQIATARSVSANSELRITALQGNWDHANVDYIEFVPTASQSAQGFAVVAAAGGDYTNPIEAVQNLSTGDSWCRRTPDEENRCVLTIEPGIYELDQTLRIPRGTTIAGADAESTELRSLTDSGVAILVQDVGPNDDVVIRDLSVVYTDSNSNTARAVVVDERSKVVVENASISASGPDIALGIDADVTGSQVAVVRSRILSDAPGVSLGIQGGSVEVDDSEILVSSTRFSRGIRLRFSDDDSEPLSVRGTTVSVDGGTGDTAGIEVTPSISDKTVYIADTRIHVSGGATRTVGLRATAAATTLLNDLSIVANGGAGADVIGLAYGGRSASATRFANISVRVTGGLRSRALSISNLDSTLEIVDSEFIAEGSSGANTGARYFDGQAVLRLRSTRVQGESTGLSIDAGSPAGATLSFVQIDGPFRPNSNNPPTLSCAAVIDGDGVFYPNSCPPRN